nr:phage integrase N-terminal SAM-like domain-containing protein [Propionivibrio sp.]
MPWSCAGLPRTRETYLACVAGLARTNHRPRISSMPSRFQSYLLHLITEKRLAYAGVNQAACDCRFLFGTVLQQRRIWRHPDGQGAQAAAGGALGARTSDGCSPPAAPCAHAPS